MDAGNHSAGSSFLSYGRHQRMNSRDKNLDRFIPNRAAMDFDYASYMLNNCRSVKKEKASSWGADYQKVLAEAMSMKRTRILSFKNKPPPPPPSLNLPQETSAFSPNFKSSKPVRYISISQDSEKTLDAPGLVDDDYLNVLDWGVNNTLAIGLHNDVHLLAESDGTVSQLLSTDDVIGPVTSVKWAPDGRHIAVGFINSEVQLWDVFTYQLVRTLREGHGGGVGSIDWNNSHILTTGDMEGLINNHDLRLRSHTICSYEGHHQEVCGLKWSTCGQRLASGGNDNRVNIWSLRMNRRLNRFSDHTGGVKALAWCPFETNLLASGGGGGDECIKFWNANTGVCLNSVNTGSTVSALLWNRHEQEILSSHGGNSNQLVLWKYPSMVKITKLCEHTSKVLNMTQSSDGCKVASLGCDERLRIWNVFGTLQET